MKVHKKHICFVILFCVVFFKVYAQERLIDAKQLQEIEKKVLNTKYNVRTDRNNKNTIVYRKSQIDISEINIIPKRGRSGKIIYRNKPIHPQVLHGYALQKIKQKVLLNGNSYKGNQVERRL